MFRHLLVDQLPASSLWESLLVGVTGGPTLSLPVSGRASWCCSMILCAGGAEARGALAWAGCNAR